MGVAIWTQTTRFLMEDPTTPGTYNHIAGFTDMNPLNATVELRDTTCLEDTVRSFGRGLADNGEASGTLLFDPTNPDHNGRTGLLSKMSAGLDQFNFAIEFPTAPLEYMLAPGVLTTFSISGATNANFTASVSIKIAGDITWTATAPTIA